MRTHSNCLPDDVYKVTTRSKVSVNFFFLYSKFIIFYKKECPYISKNNLLGRQKFFEFRNNCRVYGVGEFHIKLDYELSLFEGITVCGHAFTKDAFQVSGLNAFA